MEVRLSGRVTEVRAEQLWKASMPMEVSTTVGGVTYTDVVEYSKFNEHGWMMDVITAARPFVSNLKLRHWQKRFLAYVAQHDTDRTIFWFHSVLGNNGKSKVIKHLCATDGPNPVDWQVGSQRR